jgi:hypothetical protein
VGEARTGSSPTGEPGGREPTIERDASRDSRGREDSQTESAGNDRDQIASRAYERFQSRGGEHGRDQEDWFEAEREVNERSGKP